jgi:hypothetical protein
MERPSDASEFHMADTTRHKRVLQHGPEIQIISALLWRLSEDTASRFFTCAVGAGDGLFSRLVNSGDVGVGATGLTSAGTSGVSSPITCKRYPREQKTVIISDCMISFHVLSIVGGNVKGSQWAGRKPGIKTSANFGRKKRLIGKLLGW